MHSAFAMLQWVRRDRNHFRGKGVEGAEEVNELLGGSWLCGRKRERGRRDEGGKRLLMCWPNLPEETNIPISTGGPTGAAQLPPVIVKTFLVLFWAPCCQVRCNGSFLRK